MNKLIVTIEERKSDGDLIDLKNALIVRSWLQNDSDNTDYLDGEIQGGTDDADDAVSDLVARLDVHRDDMSNVEMEKVFNFYNFYGFWTGDDGHDKSLETMLAIEKQLGV